MVNLPCTRHVPPIVEMRELCECRSAATRDEELPGVLIVLDQAVAERDLAAASISCPSCTSRPVAPRGYARTRAPCPLPTRKLRLRVAPDPRTCAPSSRRHHD